MNRIELPLAVRLTAAAFAVFMTVAMLDGMVELAGPGPVELHAQYRSRPVAAAAHRPAQHATVVALLQSRHH